MTGWEVLNKLAGECLQTATAVERDKPEASLAFLAIAVRIKDLMQTEATAKPRKPERNLRNAC